MGSKLNAAKRRAIVEQTIRDSGWSEAIVTTLIAKTGACRSSLYEDRTIVAAKLADEDRASLDQRRALFLNSLRQAADKALAAGAFAALGRMLAMEAQLLGVDRVPLPEVEADTGPLDTSLEGVLAEVRKLRRQAQAGHSYVAADKLLEREHQLVESIRQRDEAAAAAELRHLDEGGIVELIIANVARLPDTLRTRLRDALT